MGKKVVEILENLISVFSTMIRIKASQRKNQREFFTAKAQRREENTSNSHSLRLGVSAFFLAPTWLAFMRFIDFQLRELLFF